MPNIFILPLIYTINKILYLKFYTQHILQILSCKTVALLFVFSLIYACNVTKNVPDNQFLLKKNIIEIDNKNINKEEIVNYIKQRPNRRALFNTIPFKLFVYNYSQRNRLSITKIIFPNGKISRWLNKVSGEKPVVYDGMQKRKSIKQIKSYLKNKGYYNTEITSKDSIVANKKIEIYYNIKAKTPYKIKRLNNKITDLDIHQIFNADTTNSLIKKGELFDLDNIQKERQRIEYLLQTKGYYYFSKEYVHYDVDSSLKSHNVNINVKIKNNVRKVMDDLFIEEEHVKQKIKNIYIYVNFDQKQALANPEEYYSRNDTIKSGTNVFYIYQDILNIKSRVIEQANYIKSGDVYDIRNIDATNRHLSLLKQFKTVTINFDISKDNENIPQDLLDCYIYLAPFHRQSTTFEIEGTSSSGYVGAAGNIMYQNKNLFRGAEILDIKFTGALQMRKNIVEETSQQNLFYNTIEYGTTASLHFPKLLLPVKKKDLIKKYSPKTLVSGSYNYQKRPDYTRTIANASFGYYWKDLRYGRHSITPLKVNFVEIPETTQEFLNSIENTYREQSYHDFLITEVDYSYSFNNQKFGKNKDFMFVIFNFEASGNGISTASKFMYDIKSNEKFTVYGRTFSQFVRADLDFRYYNVLSSSNRLVYRGFFGAGLPYGNSDVLPFVKHYFGGGANDIRAWSVKTLGPGGFYSSPSAYSNQTAELKLEANLEYRFDMFWMLKGAFFIDAGNIWTINNLDERDNAQFKINEFYNQIAVGAGFGTRIDLDFLIFRVDLGIKIINPAPAQKIVNPNDLTIEYIPVENPIFKDKWVLNSANISWDSPVLNIGIGYPF